jgi:hypothetical protein
MFDLFGTSPGPHNPMSSSEYAEMHLALTDGTYIDWLKQRNEFTAEREVEYNRWCALCTKYKEFEFKVLLTTTTNS